MSSTKRQVPSLDSVAAALVGKSVSRPAGTLAGHASGIPFEDLVHSELVISFPGRIFRHFEFLNAIFAANPQAVTAEDRKRLLGPEALGSLLSRGTAATEKWSIDSQFRTKQNDTAECILTLDQSTDLTSEKRLPLCLIDVKSQDQDKSGQPPNIISAQKIVNSCVQFAQSESDVLPFDICYVALQWQATDATLVCTKAKVVRLFRIPPQDIYINWAAAMQIQFHPMEVSQSYKGTPENWAYEFIKVYRNLLETRISRQRAEVTKLDNLLGSIGSGRQP